MKKKTYGDGVFMEDINVYNANAYWVRNPGFMVKRIISLAAMSVPMPSRVLCTLHRSRGVDIRNPKRVMISHGVYIDTVVPERVHIEEDVFIAPSVKIFAHFRPTCALSRFVRARVSDVWIKRGSMIAGGAIILPGVTIGECSLIGAGSVVTKDVPPYTVVAGNPAKVIRKLKR